MRGRLRGSSLLGPAIILVLFGGAGYIRSPSSLAPLDSSPEVVLKILQQELVIDGRAADFHPGGEMELQYSEEKVRRQHQAQRDWDAQAVQQNWRRYVPSGAPRSQNTTPWQQRPHGSRRMPLVWTPSAFDRSVQLPVRDPYPGITTLFSARRVIEH